jgi:hypothetical protein
MESSEMAQIISLEADLSDAIRNTGSSLFKASNALRETTVQSVNALTKSIDDFRKSNERTSKILIALTAVIGFATLVQAIYAIMLLFKK